MNQLLLLEGNPKRRHGKHRRSKAQRAATRRMLAANRRYRRNPDAPAASATPKKRRYKKRAHKTVRHYRRRSGFNLGGIGNEMLTLLKTGAIGGAGAIVTDIGMGFIAQTFPAQTTFTQRLNADGSINPVYYLTKGALAYSIGRFGSRIIPQAHAMAVGAYVVMLYEIIRSLIPAGTVPLAYYNPAPVMRGMGRQMTTAKILTLPSSGAGADTITALRGMRGRFPTPAIRESNA